MLRGSPVAVELVPWGRLRLCEEHVREGSLAGARTKSARLVAIR